MKRLYFLLTLVIFLLTNAFGQAPTNGLVAYYPFNGNANDESGSGNHGVPQNGVAFAPDRFGNAGKAASFDGVNDRISVNNHASLNFSSSFTSSFWVKMNIWAETGNNARGIISKKPNDNSAGYVFYKDGFYQSKINFRMRGSANYEYMPSNSNVIINQWEFWSMVYNSIAGKVDIYKNGVLDKTLNTGNIGNMTNSSPFYIGFSETWAGYFSGFIDEVRMYNRALSDAEVSALYGSENSSLSLTNPLRFGGGLSTLNVGTGYNLTAAIKNNGSTSWVGDLYLKVKGGTPMLLSSNNIIAAGGAYNLSTNFSPQTAQIGQNVTMELLTKQGSNDFVRVATVNPLTVNIEAASTVPVVKVPFIRLNQSEVSPGGVVQIVGGNFAPNTNVTIGSSPSIAGASYPSVTAGADGSISASFTVPTTYTERYLTLVGRDTQGNAPGASVAVKQPAEVATLSITSPYKSGETINITPNGKVSIAFSDKLLKGTPYPQSGASRSYRYEIGYQLAGSTIFNSLYQMPVETGLLNSELRKTVTFSMIGSNFSTVSQSGGWPLKFIIKDMYNNQRVAESVQVNINVVQNISKVSLKWDRSFTPMPAEDPIGIAADGVARMYLVVEKNSPTGSPIQSVSIALSNDESISNPVFNNGEWLGRVKYATQQNNNQYSEEANGINTITAQNNSTNTDGKYWFWYVAPDDFMKEGASYANESERKVKAKFTIIYADGTMEVIPQDIKIVRPPLMLVHGLSSNSSAWDNFKLTNGQTPDFKLFKGNVFKVNIQPNGFFDVNALGIINGTSIGKENSIGGVLEETRKKGFVASQVDYICHSMGGSVLRRALDNFSTIYYGNNSFYKTYQIGSVNRVITINTPHGGSPWGDLVTGIVPLLPYTFAKPLSYTYLGALSYEKEYSAYRYISSFIQPDMNSLSKNCNVFLNPFCYYTFESSPAVKNLQVISGNGGIDFKEFNLPTHVITSDFIPGQTPIPNFENTIVDIESLNSQVQFLFKIFGFMNEASGSILPPPLDDVLDEFKSIYPKIGVAEKYLSAPEKALWVLKLTEAFMLVATRYNNWWDGDLIVPLTSQQAKLNPTSPQVSYFSSSNLIDAMLNYNHIKVTDQFPVSTKVKELLNNPVSSTYFGSLPSNVRPLNNNFNKNLGGGYKANNIRSNNVKKSYKERFDRNKITISKPVSNQQINAGSQFNVEVNLQDSTNLKSVLVYFQNQDVGDTLQTRKHRFSISAENSLSRKELLLAKASYIKGDSTICYFDTLTINLQNAELLIKFNANPEVKSITYDEIFKPDYFLQYSTFGATIPDFTKLSVSISNPACLSYNSQTGQFRGTQKGEAVVIFTYDGIFKDTMYVAVGGGGLPYSQQIQTGNVPVSGDGTICTGATISVPFTTTGGVFEAGNQYIVQLSDASGENFVSLTTTGTASPLLARIPNGLSNADTYKVRVVSTSPPVIGTAAAQTLKIRNQDATPIISVQTGNWNDPATWSCKRIPSASDNVTIKAGHRVNLSVGAVGQCRNLTTERTAFFDCPTGAVFLANPNQ